MQEQRRTHHETDHPPLMLLPTPHELTPEQIDDTSLDPWDRMGLTRDERARLKGPRSLCLTDGEKHVQVDSPNHVERGPARDEQLFQLQAWLDAGFRLVG